MRSSGSRVDWKIFFVIFTKLIPRKNFFCIAKILVLMVNIFGGDFGVQKGGPERASLGRKKVLVYCFLLSLLEEDKRATTNVQNGLVFP